MRINQALLIALGTFSGTVNGILAVAIWTANGPKVSIQANSTSCWISTVAALGSIIITSVAVSYVTEVQVLKMRLRLKGEKL